MYDVHIRFIGKRVVDFLFVLIEVFRLVAHMLILLTLSPKRPNFSPKRLSPKRLVAQTSAHRQRDRNDQKHTYTPLRV